MKSLWVLKFSSNFPLSLRGRYYPFINPYLIRFMTEKGSLGTFPILRISFLICNTDHHDFARSYSTFQTDPLWHGFSWRNLSCYQHATISPMMAVLIDCYCFLHATNLVMEFLVICLSRFWPHMWLHLISKKNHHRIPNWRHSKFDEMIVVQLSVKLRFLMFCYKLTW